MMKIAVTGAAGHIGCNLVRELLKIDAYQVRVLQYRDHQALDGLGAEIVKGDIHDAATLGVFCRGVDVLFHLAAKISIGSNSYQSIYQTNVDGTKNLLKAARGAGVKRFIHFSSIHALVNEPLQETMDETRALATATAIAYEKTKALAEEWVLSQSGDDFQVVVLNPTSVIGPHDYKPSLMGQFIIRLYKNNLPGLIPGGYDWVDVRDIVRSAIAAIEKGGNGERYILSGKWTTLKELADVFGKANQLSVNKPTFPLW
ncbi:MAG: NAD-dependent epimerase/dehydratase family protein, partial [Bacteroidales bacterium]|nr:NAD-dependent epimerase/dehydratase family protein [Bacteroidales bacterium]